jgi:hypothetical protein
MIVAGLLRTIILYKPLKIWEFDQLRPMLFIFSAQFLQ